MSYHKLLQTLSNNQNQINSILTYNSSTKKLEFKNNINILNLNENNFKITNNNLIEINKINSSNISNSSLKNNLNTNISGTININNQISLNINSNYLYINSNNNEILNIKNQNIKTQFLADSQFINYGQIYGNLQYVDKEKLIPWIQQINTNDDEIEVKKGATGFELTKKNINKNITYITCDPNSTYSSYSLDDIIANTSIQNNFNFINDNNSYTNTLYLRPGMTQQTKEKYLKGFEHTFVVDTQRDLLPGWNIENNHPINQNSSYINIKNEILNNIDLKKKSQTIALDLSELINSNSVYPGYKINLIIKDPFVDIPDCLPALIQNSNDIISPNSGWQSFTFDTRYCQFSKIDIDSDSNFKSKFVNTTNSVIYDLPYYNSSQTFLNVLPSGNTTKPSGCGQSIITTNYFRQLGTYIGNNISLYYFKPYFMINLGRNNVILNDININLKKVITKNNVIPYQINESILNLLNNLLGIIDNKIKYFISSSAQALADLDIELIHLPENDQNFIQNQNLNALYLKNSNYNISNLKNNLTLKLNKSFYENKIQNYEILKIYQSLLLATSQTVLSYTYCSNFSVAGGYVKNIYNVYLIKTKSIINIPFTNVNNTINLNDSNYNDWYYLDMWKNDSHNLPSTNNSNELKDYSINDINIETKFLLSRSSTPVNKYSMKLFENTPKNIHVNNIKQNVISLMYLGKNSVTNKNEWIYV